MHFFWHFVECVDIGPSTKQTFPKHNSEYNPNTGSEEVEYFEEEVSHIDKLEYRHQPEFVDGD